MSTHEIDVQRVTELITRCRKEVDEGLLPSCQIAIGFEGEIVVDETIGDAVPETRYCFFSATKPFVAAAMWQLLSENLVQLKAPVFSYLPEFAENGKQEITVEQVMLHTSGFPHAPMGPNVWATAKSRRQRMADWRLNWEPGTRYEYHPTSAHWVLAEIINEVTGEHYADEIHRRVTTPLGLPRILGIDPEGQEGIADLTLCEGEATPDELEAVFGVRSMPPSEVNDPCRPVKSTMKRLSGSTIPRQEQWECRAAAATAERLISPDFTKHCFTTLGMCGTPRCSTTLLDRSITSCQTQWGFRLIEVLG